MTTAGSRVPALAAAIVLLAAGFGLGWVARAPADTADAETTAGSSAAAPALAGVAAPGADRPRVASVPAPWRAATAGRPRRASPGGLGVADPEVVGPVTREQIEAAQDARRAELQAQFAAEPFDATWAEAAEAGLFAAAASDEASMAEQTPDAFSTECRSRTCRVVARFPADADADGWLALFLLGGADTIGRADSLVTMRSDGTFEVTIYGRRP